MSLGTQLLESVLATTTAGSAPSVEIPYVPPRMMIVLIVAGLILVFVLLQFLQTSSG